MDRVKRNSYAAYLHVDALLKCIKPRTTEDDERLFIVVHQVHELWFNLVIHELNVCVRELMSIAKPSDVHVCVAVNERLHRVALIQRAMVGVWDVVATLPPNSFATFRAVVGKDNASGFQSVQYRIFEFLLGLKYDAIRFRTPIGGTMEDKSVSIYSVADTEHDRATLAKALASPSIYDAVVSALSKIYTNCHIEPRSDFAQRHTRDERVLHAWRDVYHRASDQAIMHQMGELLIEIEDAFRRWRHAHLLAVSRIIGGQPGTGGSAGLNYLRDQANAAVDSPICVELWEIRNSPLPSK